MHRLLWPSRALWRALIVAVAAVAMVTGGVALGNSVSVSLQLGFTPTHADQVTNIDILRSQLKNYYGTPGASSGSAAGAGWTLPLNPDSNYAREAESVAAAGERWLTAQAKVPSSAKKAIVFDVDDTTLTTWNYELYSNWDYNPSTNAVFVGLTGTTFTGNGFPATPGMLALAQKAQALGYAIFWITGRPDSQHQATIANLVSDTAAGFPDLTTTALGQPEVDAGYPAPTALDIGHGGFTDGLFTKPSVGFYPAYLDMPEFCGPSITQGKSCPTIQYKAGTRAYIESNGYDIVADFGDQYSDLLGGYADMTFKVPNPNYYLP